MSGAACTFCEGPFNGARYTVGQTGPICSGCFKEYQRAEHDARAWERELERRRQEESESHHDE